METKAAIRPFVLSLEGDQRSNKVNIYDEDLHERFVRWMERSGTSLRQLAPALRRSYTSISNYMNHKYEGDLARLEKDIHALLRRKEEPWFNTKADGFCRISTSRLVWEALQYCQEKGEMGAVIGPSGVSKTRTAEEYHKRKSGTTLLTAGPTKRSYSSILRAIANGIGSSSGGISSDDLLSIIIDRVRNTDTLLIIDEAHFLTWEAFETARAIYDQAGIGICYLGMPKLYTQMKGRKSYLWDQIFSRISISRSVSRIEKEDVKLIADSIHPGLTKGCLNFLYEVAKEPGKLRVMTKLLKRAIEFHKTEKIPITLDLLKKMEHMRLF